MEGEDDDDDEDDEEIFIQSTRHRPRSTPKKKKSETESVISRPPVEVPRTETPVIGTEFVDGLEYVTNIITDHVFPYVVLSRDKFLMNRNFQKMFAICVN